jgi:hypothetical protein
MKHLVSAVIVLLVSTIAHAEDDSTNLHLFGGLGVASYDVSEDEVADAFIDQGFSSVQGTIDDSPVMFKIGAGFGLNDNVAIEAAYTNLGTIDVSGTTTGPSAAFTSEIETTGFEASILGRHAVSEDFHLIGRFGIYAWDTEVDVSASSGGLTASDSSSSDGTDVTFGGGLEYKNFRLEYQRYTLDDQDVNTVQAAYIINL